MSGALIVVAEWPKNDREVVRVVLDEYNGHPLVNARLWFRGDGGEMRPGKGLSVGIRHLPALAEAFSRALAIATEQGLIKEGAN
ncbi:transcriptional coactivator p15/PC4 family protein [Bosea sp. NPDC003192]|uniref:transcriptional coactivator p15/PC4 family protein n=1 Tax=Bosea sp. NPDC003192 TaxID=3390551 RepID=UPI003CFF1A97